MLDRPVVRKAPPCRKPPLTFSDNSCLVVAGVSTSLLVRGALFRRNVNSATSRPISFFRREGELLGDPPKEDRKGHTWHREIFPSGGFPSSSIDRSFISLIHDP